MGMTDRGGIDLVRTFVWVLSVGCVMLASCFEGRREPAEADLSAFSVYVDSLDTLRLQQTIRQLVDNDTSNWTADKNVAKRYTDKNVLRWSSRMGVSADADTLLAFLRRELPRNGLDTVAFGIPQIAADLAVVHQLAFDSVGRSINEVLPHLDYYLSKAYVRYTVGQRYGFTRPEKILNKLDHKAHSEDPNEYARLFDYEIDAPDYETAVEKLTAADRLDFLRASRPSGQVYAALQACIDTAANKDVRRKLAVNLERCRWRIKHPAESGRRVVVNLAAQQLWAVCPDSVLSMRICCGAQPTKTPLLDGELSYMQVNPDWIIPHTIVKTEVAHHGGESAYFSRHNYYIVEKASGDTLSPDDVTPSELRSGQLRVGQRGGAGNSLGRIVFRFANNFSVYLHDTNNRNAFNYQRRTLSHGCVRVQKPFELACFLLPEADDWLKDRLRLSMDISPETERGKKYLKEHKEDQRPFRLLTYHPIAPKVPLYIVYFTAYPNPETQEMELWPDIYGFDRVLSKAMSPLLVP